MKGYKGGRLFKNNERRLPLITANGKLISYREWDIHPYDRNINRGPERLVTGDDGSVFFTYNHYKTFQKIR